MPMKCANDRCDRMFDWDAQARGRPRAYCSRKCSNRWRRRQWAKRQAKLAAIGRKFLDKKGTPT